MMGYEEPPQPSLFYTRLNLEQRIRPNHPLRAIDRLVDFDFVYAEVADRYGMNGHVSEPPPRLLKLMLLLVLYDVPSERELMTTLPERLDWLWFLGLDLDSKIPNHSVLSKARARWGAEVFRALFERTITACVDAGLVDARKLFCDSSVVRANASKNSLLDRYSLRRYLNSAYKKLEKRLELDAEKSDSDDSGPPSAGPTNRRLISTTDPEAALVGKRNGKTELGYKTHRAIDARAGVITATTIGSGVENEAHRLPDLIEQHQLNTGRPLQVVVADSQYGTNNNYLWCHDRGIAAHIPPRKDVYERSGRRGGLFPDQVFTYDPITDTLVCPAGQTLRRHDRRPNGKGIRYRAAPSVCRQCHLQRACTASDPPQRFVTRHERQKDLERMYAQARSPASRVDLKTRKHFMEGSFAQATRFGLKQARWRGIQRLQIQDLLIAAVQNLGILLRHGRQKPRAVMVLALGFIHWIQNHFPQPLLLHQFAIIGPKT